MNKFFSYSALLLFLLIIYNSATTNIVIITPSYNNIDYYERNLASILAQESCSCIYIDDASNDGTGDAVQQYLAQHDTEGRVTYIRNNERKGAMANHWLAAHMCQPDDIIVHLDGDDWFAHNDVIKRIREAYADGTTWVTYGQYREWPSGSMGHCRLLTASEESNIRGIGLPLPISHLRTFKAKLLQSIPLKEFIVQGVFYPSAADAAFLLPIFEQAQGHIKFIPEVLYEYNTQTPINDYKVRLQETLYCFHHIKQRAPLDVYHELPEPSYKADLVIYSYNRPMQLYALLESIESHLYNCGTVTIIYKTNTHSKFNEGYEIVKKRFQNCIFIQQDSTKKDFKELTIKALQSSINDYCLFAMDDNFVLNDIDLSECIHALEKTKAHGFYLRLGKNITYSYNSKKSQAVPLLLPIEKGICAWQFNHQRFDDWNYPNSLDMTIFKKSSIMRAFTAMDYHNPNSLEGAWYNPEYIDFNQVGLCYEASRIVNIPMNTVQSTCSNPHMNVHPYQLLKKFLNGERLEYSTKKMINSPHMELDYTFHPAS